MVLPYIAAKLGMVQDGVCHIRCVTGDLFVTTEFGDVLENVKTVKNVGIPYIMDCPLLMLNGIIVGVGELGVAPFPL